MKSCPPPPPKEVGMAQKMECTWMTRMQVLASLHSSPWAQKLAHPMPPMHDSGLMLAPTKQTSLVEFGQPFISLPRTTFATGLSVAGIRIQTLPATDKVVYGAQPKCLLPSQSRRHDKMLKNKDLLKSTRIQRLFICKGQAATIQKTHSLAEKSRSSSHTFTWIHGPG